MAETLPVVAEPGGQRVERLRRGALPLGVWLVLAAIAAVLLTDRVRFVEHAGLAEALEVQISPTVTGRLQAVLVSLNDAVAAGEVVAVMEDAQVRAATDVAHANLRRLRAELTAAAASLAADSGAVVTDLLRLQMDEESRRLDALSLRATVAGDTVDVERRRLEMQRAAALSEEGLAPRSEHENARLAHDALVARTEQTRALLAQTEAEWHAARGRREAYERRLPSPAAEPLLLAPLREAVSVEEARLREIDVQRESLVLRSPVAGQVSQVWCRGGQSLRPGDPVLTIAESEVRDIVVYVGEAHAHRFTVEAAVSVSRRGVPRDVARSTVVSVGDSVQPLPQRLWRDPRVPGYGRAVVVASVPALNLSPGEVVDVALARR